MKTELERTKEALEKALSFVENGCTNNFYAQLVHEVNGILNPPPEYEEVPVVRWECTGCGEIGRPKNNEDKIICCDCGAGKDKQIKLTGTFNRLKKRMVEKSVTVNASLHEGGAVKETLDCPVIKDSTAWGKTGALTFTWTEQED